MRLDKLLAHTGYGTRTEVKKLLKSKEVKVDGVVVKDAKVKVDLSKQCVTVFDEVVEYREFVYLMMNKPAGVVSATFDNKDETVIDLLEVEHQVFEPFPVGRLDKDTVGLLLLTNDGDLTYKLTHPKHEVDKTYMAIVKGVPNAQEIKNFEEGLYIEDYKTAPAKIKVVKINEEKNYSICQIKIHEGRNRQVRKMCRAINHPVLRLRRAAMGKIVLKDLEVGKYRHLTKEEVAYLKSIK